MVPRSQDTIRITRSPSEVLDVHLGRGNSGGVEGAADGAGPLGRPAGVDVAVGGVRNPAAQRGEVAGGSLLAEARVGGAAAAGQPQELQAAFAGERVELAGEQRTPGRALQEDRV